jgi:hypothetical protein
MVRRTSCQSDSCWDAHRLAQAHALLTAQALVALFEDGEAQKQPPNGGVRPDGRAGFGRASVGRQQQPLGTRRVEAEVQEQKRFVQHSMTLLDLEVASVDI